MSRCGRRGYLNLPDRISNYFAAWQNFAERFGRVTVHYDDLSRNERIRGGLDGLLIGDALGVPYEFHDASDIPLFHEIEMEPPTRFNRAHKGVPIGTWSDDGAQALCLVESLVHDPKLNLDDLGRRLLAWYEKGYLTPDGRVFDVGIQTSEAMRAMQLGVEASNAGRRQSLGPV
jgi:ADP-ribosyl-[dinitrogen reductase] hydrolase